MTITSFTVPFAADHSHDYVTEQYFSNEVGEQELLAPQVMPIPRRYGRDYSERPRHNGALVKVAAGLSQRGGVGFQRIALAPREVIHFGGSGTPGYYESDFPALISPDDASVLLARMMTGNYGHYYSGRPRNYEDGVRIAGLNNEDWQVQHQWEQHIAETVQTTLLSHGRIPGKHEIGPFPNRRERPVPAPDHDPQVARLLREGPLLAYADDSGTISAERLFWAESIAAMIGTLSGHYLSSIDLNCSPLPGHIRRGGTAGMTQEERDYYDGLRRTNTERQAQSFEVLIRLWREATEQNQGAVTVAQYLDYVRQSRRPEDFRDRVQAQIRTQVLTCYPGLDVDMAHRVAGASFDRLFADNRFVLLPPDLEEQIYATPNLLQIPSLEFHLDVLRVLDPALFAATRDDLTWIAAHRGYDWLKFPQAYPRRILFGSNKDKLELVREERSRPYVFYTGTQGPHALESRSGAWGFSWHDSTDANPLENVVVTRQFDLTALDQIRTALNFPVPPQIGNAHFADDFRLFRLSLWLWHQAYGEQLAGYRSEERQRLTGRDRRSS